MKRLLSMLLCAALLLGLLPTAAWAGDGETFVPGLAINHRDVEATVDGATKGNTDEGGWTDYSFDEQAESVTVTFDTANEHYHGIRVRAHSAADSDWDSVPWRDLKLPDGVYTITDLSNFYEIEVIDWEMPYYDNEFRVGFDDYDGFSVTVGGEAVRPWETVLTFHQGDEITITTSEAPYKVLIRQNNGVDKEPEGSGTSFTYTPDSDTGFEVAVYRTEGAYNYDQFWGTEELPVIVEYWWDIDGTPITPQGVASENMIQDGNHAKVRLPVDTPSLTFAWETPGLKMIRVDGAGENGDWLEIENPQESTYTLPLDQDREFYCLEYCWHNDPGAPAGPGLAINDHGVTVNVVGADSNGTDEWGWMDYSFAETAESVTVTFDTANDRYHGIRVRAHSLEGESDWESVPWSDLKLENGVYTITDLSKFYEIEVIEWNQPCYDKEFVLNYDPADDFSVTMGGEVVEPWTDVKTFEAGQPLNFTASEAPYKVVVRPSTAPEEELEVNGAEFTYTPKSNMGFEVRVFRNEAEYIYEMLPCDWETQFMAEYQVRYDRCDSTAGTVTYDVTPDGFATYGDRTRLVLDKEVTEVRLTIAAAEGYIYEVWANEQNVTESVAENVYTWTVGENSNIWPEIVFRSENDPGPDPINPTITLSGSTAIAEGEFTYDHGTARVLFIRENSDGAYVGNEEEIALHDDVTAVKIILTAEEGYKGVLRTGGNNPPVPEPEISGNEYTYTFARSVIEENGNHVVFTVDFEAPPAENVIAAAVPTITTPTAGATVDSIQVTEESGAHYGVSLEWWDLVPQKGSTASLDSLYYDDTFEADRWYCAVLDLKADFGYRFAEHVDLQIEGAEQVEIVKHKGNMLEVYAWYQVGTPPETVTPITSVAVTNVTEAAPGGDIDTAEDSTEANAELSGEGYELRSAYYYMWEDSKWSWESSGEFAADTVYGVELDLRVQPGYLFDENVTVTINGKPAQVWSWEDGELEVFLPFDDVIITDVSVTSNTWPIEDNPIDKSPENFYLSSSHSSYTLQSAEFQKLDYGTGEYRSLSEAETTFLLGQYHKYRVQAVLKAMDGAVFGDSVSGSFNGTGGVVCEVSEDGKTCTVTRPCAVYYRVESYDDNTGNWMNGVTVQIPTPAVGGTPRSGQYVEELYGVSASYTWYEVPYPGSTYRGKRLGENDTFEADKVYLYYLNMDNKDNYRFADGFTARFEDMDGNDAPCVQKETVSDTARTKRYYLWYEVGDIEYQKITHITVTGPALDEEGRIPTSDLSAFTIEGGAELNMAGWYPVSSYFGQVTISLIPSPSHYFGRDSELTFTYKVRGTEDVFTGSVTTSSNDHLGSASASVKLAEWVYVSGTITAKDKVYDGTTAAELDLSGAELYGVAEGDDVQLSAENVTAVFDSAEVGQNKPVTVTGNFTLTGADAKKYYLFQPTLEGLTASITAQPVGSYTITLSPAANGTVTADQTKAQAGTTVTLTAAPNQGYKLDSLTVTAAGGSKLTLTDKGNGKYTFTMPGSNVTVAAVFRGITYSVTVTRPEHGSAAVSPANAAAGATVTVTVKPDAGYQLEKLTVTDAGGKAITLTDKGDGTYTFTMPASNVTVSAVFSRVSLPFTDVPEKAYYYDAVAWAVGNGITKGISPTKFSPNDSCTRAQTVTFLWRAAGSPTPKGSAMPFTDVVKGSFYEKAVLWAVENGITEGTSKTTFSPNATCTRAQIATFLWRAQGKPEAGTANPFKDVVKGSYYEKAVLWAAEKGITKGTTATTFSPNDSCTRAQNVAFLYRCMGN